jgi:hypothetical protein
MVSKMTGIIVQRMGALPNTLILTVGSILFGLRLQIVMASGMKKEPLS